MNAGILRKTLRDTLPLLAAMTVGILLFEMLFVRALREIPVDLGSQWLRMPIARSILRTLLGADLAEQFTPAGLVMVGFVHPLVYALTWTLLLVTGSRVLAGEVDRGTADLLLTLPVSRTRVYFSVSAVVVLAALPVSAAPFAGVKLATYLFPLEGAIPFARYVPLSVNLFALNLAIGGVTLLLSAASSRRGTPIAAALSLLLGSFLLNFLAQFWPAVEHVAFLGFLSYYRPLPIVATGAWPLRDLATLAGIASAAWGAGWWRFCHRDIPAA